MKKKQDIKLIKTVDLPKAFKHVVWGEFLRKQQTISYLLFYLILAYCEGADENFKNWFKSWLEKQSLGRSVFCFKNIVFPHLKDRIFKIYRPQGYAMEEAIKMMEDYCARRNTLTHKVIQTHFKSNREILEYVKETNEEAKVILGILEILWKEEVDKRLQEVENAVEETKTLIKREIDKELWEADDKIKDAESKLRTYISNTPDSKSNLE